MLSIFIKYYSIILCSIYSFIHLLFIHDSKQTTIGYFIFPLILTIPTTLLDISNTHISLFFLIICTFLYLHFTYKQSIELTITTTIISYGISYAFFLVCNFLSTLMVAGIFYTINYINIFNTSALVQNFIQLLIAMFQFICIQILFSIKRFSNGMPFLTDKLASPVVMLTSLSLLYTYLLLTNLSQINIVFITIYFIAFLIAITLYISWRNNITRTYIDRVRKHDIDSLNEHFDEIEAHYKEVEADKDELAKIVHTDNKLVPAMLLSVKTFLTEFPDVSPEMRARGEALVKELEIMSDGRTDILKKQDMRCNAKLLTTGIPDLDGVLRFIQEQAYEDKMELSVSADNHLNELIEHTLTMEELKTLAADLLTNAMIANRHAGGKRILFSIAKVDNALCLSIFDTGIPFTKEVLVDFGIVKHTTHGDDGGSGIGLMTIFEIIKRYKASIIIDEYHTNSALYTKRIAILFNKRSKYILTTARPKDEILYLKQRNDLTVIEQSDNKM